MLLVQVLVGGGLLILGRKLFWFLVAGFGFIAGLGLAQRFLPASPAWVALLLALGAGLIGALLALFLEQAAIALAGFFGGGYILNSLIDLLGVRFTRPEWLVPLVGGILGVVLVFSLLSWALIVLSSMAGATLVTQAFQMRLPAGLILYLVLLIAGIVIQGSLLRREGRRAGR